MAACGSRLCGSERAAGAGGPQRPRGVAAAALAAVASAVAPSTSAASGAGADADELPMYYDAPRLARYFARRPLQLSARLTSIASRGAAFGAKLLADRAGGDEAWVANQPARARELRQLLTEAGPAYIKIGQAVSIRPDILPEAYTAELSTLQDSVQPFASDEARAILEDELGGPLSRTFADADAAFAEPVAAASLGQVYRARLADGGEEVAVKVQRPDVLENVALDLTVIRYLLEAGARLPGDALQQTRESCEATIGLIETVAGRFLEELDYKQEARNGARFGELMGASDDVGAAVVVPKVYENLTSRYVHVAQWIDGVKISAITDASERRELVRALLGFYLVQLLETGLLHADPHPGNFLRTPEGRLAVLDYGLMTEVSEDQRLAFIEYIAKLTGKDYGDTLPQLAKLGFVPEEVASDPAKAAIVAPLIASVLEQISAEGGAEKIDVGTLGDELEEIAKEYPVRIPPYFVLILRAFSTIEGLGLQADAQYGIVEECFPYIARRLLTDPHPRVRAALRTFLYGTEDKLSVERVREMAAGFGEFTELSDEFQQRGARATAAGPGGRVGSAGSGRGSETESAGVVDKTSREWARLLFSPEGTYVQDLLLDEAVRSVDAMGRGALAQLGASLAAREGTLPVPGLAGPGVLPGGSLLLAPARGAVAVASRLAPVTKADEEALATVEAIYSLLVVPAIGATSAASSAGALAPPSRSQVLAARELLPDVLPGVQAAAQRFSVKLTSRVMRRLADTLAAGAP
eukprot:PRCOL_00006987-RA